MADCGICLDVLRNPVSIVCGMYCIQAVRTWLTVTGHVHCERCLRGHINSGTDALKSTCPTCRKPFHIGFDLLQLTHNIADHLPATPDFTFVPQKYHDFILPSVRKIYMDIPSVAALTAENGILTQRLDTFAKENEHLRQRSIDYKHRLEDMETERHTIIEQRERALQEADDLRRKYDILKRKYWEVQSR